MKGDINKTNTHTLYRCLILDFKQTKNDIAVIVVVPEWWWESERAKVAELSYQPTTHPPRAKLFSLGRSNLIVQMDMGGRSTELRSIRRWPGVCL